MIICGLDKSTAKRLQVFSRMYITVSVCVVTDFEIPRYQIEMVLMRAINLDTCQQQAGLLLYPPLHMTHC